MLPSVVVHFQVASSYIAGVKPDSPAVRCIHRAAPHRRKLAEPRGTEAFEGPGAAAGGFG